MKPTNRPCKRATEGQSGLRPLPADFCWQVLGLLSEQLLDDCSDSFRAEFVTAVRNRRADLYHELSKRWGLQSIPPDVTAGSAVRWAAQLQLSQMAKKAYALEVASAKERAVACLAGVIQLDRQLPAAYHWPTDGVKCRVRRILGEILGSTPTVDEIGLRARHGPGSAVHSKKGHESSYFKYEDWPYSVTPRARALFVSLVRSDARWWGALDESYRKRYRVTPWSVLDQEVFWKNIVKDVPYNRITTVPKDGAKDRPIAIEPEGNIYLQLGIEGIIRDKLRRWGVDLNDQTRNQRLAELGSLMSHASTSLVYPATLDLSNASDTLLRVVCRDLLPAGWFELLDSVRADFGMLPDGTAWRYAKMSSMGNGATFALESLVFFAIITAVSEEYGCVREDAKYISVYGDDCEYPCYLDVPVRAYFRMCGFQVNHAKSFASGPVRESCGCDYLHGLNVRPVYLPDRMDSLESMLALHNGLRRWFARTYGTEMPRRLSQFLRSYAAIGLGFGPESDTDMSSYWHSSHRFHLPVGPEDLSVRVPCLSRRTRELPGKEFSFRKLMHALASCEGGEGHFLVTRRELGKPQIVHRRLMPSSYELGGGLQDYARLAHEETRASSAKT